MPCTSCGRGDKDRKRCLLAYNLGKPIYSQGGGIWRFGNKWYWYGAHYDEADRRAVPLANKPRQSQLTGWTSEVITGNAISVDNPESPRINHDNTRNDRMFATGEKSLLITDTKPFERKVSQKIADVPDGIYRLSLKVRGSGDFGKLTLSVLNGKNRQTLDLKGPGEEWRAASLDSLQYGGEVVIEIEAVGKSGAKAIIDDIELRGMTH